MGEQFCAEPLEIVRSAVNGNIFAFGVVFYRLCDDFFRVVHNAVIYNHGFFGFNDGAVEKIRFSSSMGKRLLL